MSMMRSNEMSVTGIAMKLGLLLGMLVTVQVCWIGDQLERSCERDTVSA